MAIHVQASFYDAREISLIRQDLVARRQAACPRHTNEAMLVTWTRMITLDDGLRVPVFADVRCMRCAGPVAIDLLQNDPPLPDPWWPED